MRGKGARGKTRLGEGQTRCLQRCPKSAARRRAAKGNREVPVFVRIFFFPLSQEGVPSHCRDMECPNDEAPIAQLENKLSAPPLAGAYFFPSMARRLPRRIPACKRANTKRRAPQAHSPPAEPRRKYSRAEAAQISPRRSGAKPLARASYTLNSCRSKRSSIRAFFSI